MFLINMGGNTFFKHESMGLAIFIVVILQVLAEFNSPPLPPPSDTKCKDEDM